MEWRTFQVCLFLHTEGGKWLHNAASPGKVEKTYKFMHEEYGFFCGFLLKLGEDIALIIEKEMDVRGMVCRFCIIYRKNGRIMRIREGAGI